MGWDKKAGKLLSISQATAENRIKHEEAKLKNILRKHIFTYRSNTSSAIGAYPKSNVKTNNSFIVSITYT